MKRYVWFFLFESHISCMLCCSEFTTSLINDLFHSLLCLSNSSEVFALNELRSELGFSVCCKDAIAAINFDLVELSYSLLI